MKLTKQAIESLDAREKRLQLALKLGFTEVWIDRLITKNKPNGPLVTVTALNVIREQTGLTDSEILEEESIEQD